MSKQTMPLGSQDRKNVPIVTGVLDYFPAALAAVARLSKFGNDKHNPGQPLHWSRGKSADHADCIGRHLVDRGIIDPETNMSHTVEVAWRALALLQLEEEQNGAPISRGSRETPTAIPQEVPSASKPSTTRPAAQRDSVEATRGVAGASHRKAARRRR